MQTPQHVAIGRAHAVRILMQTFGNTAFEILENEESIIAEASYEKRGKTPVSYRVDYSSPPFQLRYWMISTRRGGWGIGKRVIIRSGGQDEAEIRLFEDFFIGMTLEESASINLTLSLFFDDALEKDMPPVDLAMILQNRTPFKLRRIRFAEFRPGTRRVLFKDVAVSDTQLYAEMIVQLYDTEITKWQQTLKKHDQNNAADFVRNRRLMRALGTERGRIREDKLARILSELCLFKPDAVDFYWANQSRPDDRGQLIVELPDWVELIE